MTGPTGTPAQVRLVPRHPKDHDQRVSLSEIMHHRALPIAGAPVRVRQWLFTDTNDCRDKLAEWVEANFPGVSASAQNRAEKFTDEGVIIWERHSEFSTVTIIREGEQSFQPIAQWYGIDAFPGDLFRSVEIFVGNRTQIDWDCEARFDEQRLVSSFVFDGAARLWSDFTIRENGSGRIIVENIGLKNDEAARLVQTLIEIGNYRKMALLGFPLARDLMPWITKIEREHSRITGSHNSGKMDGFEVLRRLTSLSAEVELRSGLARFRLGATSSYHLLTTDRIRSLRETRVAGHSTIAEFIERRLLPAMRTCEISQQRLESLSKRIHQTASLLSLEQTTELNRKNESILTSLNNRAADQFHLQNLIERFSIFAISYYMISIAEKIIDPLKINTENERSVYSSALAASILLITWIALKLGRRRSG